MSTTFGIRIPCKDEGEKDTIIEIAYRYSIGNGQIAIDFEEPFVKILDVLDDDYPIEALDNTPQGIYTIGDLKEAANLKDSFKSQLNMMRKEIFGQISTHPEMEFLRTKHDLPIEVIDDLAKVCITYYEKGMTDQLKINGNDKA
jgi:hypothetical protein